MSDYDEPDKKATEFLKSRDNFGSMFLFLAVGREVSPATGRSMNRAPAAPFFFPGYGSKRGGGGQSPLDYEFATHRQRFDILCLRWQHHDGKPVIAYAANDAQKLVEIDRLDNVGTAPQLIHLEDVLFGFGCSQNDHRQLTELVIGNDFRQHFTAIHHRKVQIQQDKVRCQRIGILALLA
jgi:hypothetical protein